MFSLFKKSLFKIKLRCSLCGNKAASVSVDKNYVMKYEGPGGSNGSGDKISTDQLHLIINAFSTPFDPKKLKDQFYDRAGFCPLCEKFYCSNCWNISHTGFGKCPAGHGESLDPHWSTD
jgi:hypothetical protein